MNGNQDESGHLIDEATKTPRTDACYNDDESPTYRGYISVNFARQLETELADKDKQLADALERLAKEKILRKTAEAEMIEFRESSDWYEKFRIERSEHLATQSTLTDISDQLAEARAEIERLRARNAILDNAIAEMTEEQAELRAAEEIITLLVEAKDELIEQMREEIARLKRCCNCEYANHKLEVCENPDNEPETYMDGMCDLWSHNI